VGVVKDAAGKITELRCTYDPETKGGYAPDGRQVKATLHWVSAKQAVTGEMRLYDRLFTKPAPGEEHEGDFKADLNPNSLEVLKGCRLEPSLVAARPGDFFQFERMGYFCVDKDAAPGAPVFNRTVTLKDPWAKMQQAGKK
jgi:glutaminyl-tRNA synthetase